MGESDELIKAHAIAKFPGLSTDSFFRISSPKDCKYNCIAWAFGLYKDRWMQFDTKPRYDGVWYWWPEGVATNQTIQSYIEAFKTKGFELCNEPELEPEFIKIALYVEKDTEICTHAARQKSNGIWMSKLGPWHYIEHGTPFTIEGDTYGKVYCIMKMKR